MDREEQTGKNGVNNGVCNAVRKQQNLKQGGKMATFQKADLGLMYHNDRKEIRSISHTSQNPTSLIKCKLGKSNGVGMIG